jgi:hypothetical protein
LDVGYGFVPGTPTVAGAFNYSITATDSGTPAQSAAQSVSGTILAIATTTALSASHNPAMLGQSVTLTAAITPSSATGAVTFKDGATTLCASAAITSGQATCQAAFNSAGTHPIKADYIGSSGSSDELAPFASYTDSFTTTRWLASSTLAGRWSAGGWTVRPSASVSYI